MDKSQFEHVLLNKEIHALWMKIFHSIELEIDSYISDLSEPGSVELRDRLRDFARTLGEAK